MKKLLTILLVLAVVGPTASYLCSAVSADPVASCAMEKLKTCCCEKEVKNPGPPESPDYVAPSDTSLPEIAVSTSPVCAPSSDAVYRSLRAPSTGSTDTPEHLFLQYQSFLI